MKILISGSVAYDRIMDFPGKFADHILPDKIHILNVSFLLDSVTEKFGGTAGNIAYNLALLEEKATIFATVGRDFGPYENWMRKHGITMDGIRKIEDELTASAYITTDKSDNQITGFNPGAMKHQANYQIKDRKAEDTIAIISPGNMEDMLSYSRTYKENSIPFIFDPGQQAPIFSRDQMLELVSGSSILIANDYELQLIEETTSFTKNELLDYTSSIIVTLGEKGSIIYRKDQEPKNIPPAKAREVKDPTGAGDSYRAGLLKGFVLGRELTDAARMGAACASFAVECYGTQEHSFTLEEFQKRYQANFG
ncbi:MAG: carbohydrate kinase family protein [Thermodesulfobacteriota bacterium]